MSRIQKILYYVFTLLAFLYCLLLVFINYDEIKELPKIGYGNIYIFLPPHLVYYFARIWFGINLVLLLLLSYSVYNRKIKASIITGSTIFILDLLCRLIYGYLTGFREA